MLTLLNKNCPFLLRNCNLLPLLPGFFPNRIAFPTIRGIFTLASRIYHRIYNCFQTYMCILFLVLDFQFFCGIHCHMVELVKSILIYMVFWEPVSTMGCLTYKKSQLTAMKTRQVAIIGAISQQSITRWDWLLKWEKLLQLRLW